MPESHKNLAVPDANDYYPLNTPEIGRPLKLDENTPKLFTPLTIKGVEFKNRIFVAPMCQYSARDGHVTDFHLVHLGTFAKYGAGAVCVEATSVTPEGRISPEDNGLWSDSHIAPLKRIVEFCHAQGAKIGIQLAHAGRKGSTYAPWIKNRIGHGGSWVAEEDENGWPDNVLGPSDVPYSEHFPIPKAMTEEQMKVIEDAFVAATKRCEQIGFDFIEIHSAHGYLLHNYLSPISNTRTDSYGGSLENRMRYPLQIASRVRAAWPSKPLFVRLSGIEWHKGPERSPSGEWVHWGIEQSSVYVGELKKLGVDYVDVSTGGNYSAQELPHPILEGYQAPYAQEIKKNNPDMLVSAVGMISDPEYAEGLLQGKDGQPPLDAVRLARELLRHPAWPMTAAQKLGVKVKPPNQYERAFGF